MRKEKVKQLESTVLNSDNHILQQYLKALVNGDKYLSNFIKLTNVCINIGFWPSYFKISIFIIIPKPNKAAYNSLKTFYPIILLNTLEKLIEKVISKRLQMQSIVSNFIYPNQLRGLKQCSTTDIGLYLSQTSFSLYLHNQWTDFHKLSCAGKPKMRAIRICAGCTKVTTND